jgi:hypothetical protein
MCLVNRVKDILADFMNCVRHLPDNPDNPETPDSPVPKVFIPIIILIKNRIIPFS